MIRIDELPSPMDEKFGNLLDGIATSDLGHQRFWGQMCPAIRPVIPGLRIVGNAITVIAPGFDSAIIPHALGLVRPGDVLVIDRLGDELNACLGSVVTLAAKITGVVGIIIDGYATDFQEMRSVGLPVWCRGESAAMSKLLGIAGAINLPVSCGGVAVLPGNLIVADDNGVCVLPRDDVETIAAAAQAGNARRPERLDRIRAGEQLGLINGISAKIEAAIRIQHRS
jgi:4-hydroxy-4-methyl-2-oxoglutarate aldolase